MSTMKFNCPTLDDTQNLAAVIGAVLKGGEVITFSSDLGGGKTAFVKGLARGMGVTGVVQSPTFTLSQIHKGSAGRELHHYDFYRLSDPGIMKAELAESLLQPNAVVTVEWGDIVHDIFPADQLRVTLATGEAESRLITIAVPQSLPYVLDALNTYKNQKGLA